MAKACSTKDIPTAVLRGYERKKSTKTKLDFINKQLDPTVENTPARKHLALINQINQAYPGYIDQDEITQFLPVTSRGVTRPVVATQTEMDLDASKEAKVKTRGKKPSSRKVAKPEQTADSKTTPEGEAALKRGTKSAGPQAKDPKVDTKETEPSGPVKPKSTVGKKQQPADIIFEATDEWQNFPEGAIAPGGAEFRLSLTDPTQRQIRLLPTKTQPEAPQSTINRDQDPDTLRGQERLALATQLMETAAGRTEEFDFEKGARILMKDVLFDPPTGKKNVWWNEMAALVNRPEGNGILWESPEQLAISREVFLDLAKEYLVSGSTLGKTFTTTKDGVAGVERDWVRIALDMGWFVDTIAVIDVTPTKPSARINDITKSYTSNPDATVEDIVAEVKESSKRSGQADEATFALVDMVTDSVINRQSIALLQNNPKAFASRVSSLVADGADLSFVVEGAPLSDWFPNNTATIENGKLKRPTSAEQSTQAKLDIADTRPVEGRNSNIETGRPITQPMPTNSQRAYIRKVVKGLNKRVAPLVMNVADLAEFKKKYPKQYREAVASRPDNKNIINENTAGHSFGNTVVIFRNNIKNKQHLAFVLGHEIIGHFGLASIMPKAKLKTLMDSIYDTDPRIRAEAIRRMSVYNMNKTEAVEEAVADLAGVVESQTIIRVWNAIKTFLNKLGVKFSDDMARYYVNQSRRMVRNGTTGDVSANGIYSDLMDIQDRYVEGRSSDNLASSAFSHKILSGQVSSEGLWSTITNIAGDMTSAEGIDTNIGKLSATVSNFATNFGRFAEILQTLDQKATRNRGLQELYKIFENQSEHVKRLQTILNDKTNFSHRYDPVSRILTGTRQKVTKENENDWQNGPPPQKFERDQANQLLQEARLFRYEEGSEALIREQGSLLNISPEGAVTRNEEVIKKVIDAGSVTRKQFEAGLRTPKKDDAGNIIKGDPRIYKPDFKINDRVWRLYTEQRNAVNEASIMVYEDKVIGMLGSQKIEIDDIVRKNKLTPEQGRILHELSAIHSKLYQAKPITKGNKFEWNPESVEAARVFMYQAMRVMDSKNGDRKLNDWINGSSDPNDAGLEAFRNDKDFPQDFSELVEKLKVLNKAQLSERRELDARRTIQDLEISNSQLINAEYKAINEMLTSYVPFGRKGQFQVRVQAYRIVGGKEVPVDLDESVKSMLYYTRTESKQEANQIRDALNKEFNTYDTSETTIRVDGGKQKANEDGTLNPDIVNDIVFRAESSTASSTSTLANGVNYDDVANTLLRAGVSLKQKDRDNLIKMMTNQHSVARKRMEFSQTPGWEQDMMRGIAEHLETQTHIAGKNRFKHQVSRVVADKTAEPDLWDGNLRELERRQNAYRDAADKSRKGYNEAKSDLAFMDMTSYQHSYIESSSKQNITILKRDLSKSTVDGKGKSGQYKNDANKLVEFYNNTANIAEATGEEKFGKMFGKFATVTAAMQLGGAIAPALINLTSLGSHAIPYLSTINNKTGYGGGFGPGVAAAAIYRAGSDMSLIKAVLKMDDVTGTAAKLDVLLNGTKENPKVWKEGERVYNMTRDELQFLQSLTEKGVLTPNMFNALVGTSRTGKQSNQLARMTETWMKLFSKTEQYNRRVTALASYRLEKERQLKAGAKESDFATGKTDAAKHVYARSITAVNASQGNYAQYNRPHLARGNVAQYLYMYKQFVVITVQLMRNLGSRERLIMLGLLVLMSGVKGIPFAEDFMDLVDTLMQKFGIKSKGVEAYISEISEAMIPGSSRILMRGFGDYLLGATVSNRLGHGNLLPGTTFFLAGSDTGREIADVAGPIVSAMQGIVGGAALIANYAAETVGLKPDVTSFEDIARTGLGSSGLKAIAESFIFMSDGTITNKRGQVVARDFGPFDMVTRMLGFYPSAATTQYDINRMTQRARDYSRVIKEGFVARYRKADTAKERRFVRREVREWNRDAGKKSPFYIRNFTDSANRSAREAKRTATGRLLKSAPKSVRAMQKDLMLAYGIDIKGNLPDELSSVNQR